MKKAKTTHTFDDDLSLVMKATIGAVVLSLITSFSTQHIVAQAETHHKVVTPDEANNIFEREREILHAHSNLSRSRYATVSGTSS